MPFWPIEVALLAGLLWVSWRIARNGFARALIGAAARVCAVLAVLLVPALAGPVLNAVTRNFVVRLIDNLVLGTLVYSLAVAGATRLARRRDGALLRLVAQRLPAWLDRSLCGVTIAALWLAALLCVDSVGRLVTVSNFRGSAERTSVLVRYFLRPAPVELPPLPPDAGPQDVLEQQRRLLAGSGSLIGKALDYAAGVTGTRQFVAQLDALKTITDLPYADRAWVVQSNPELLALLKNPDVARVLRNDRVFDLIDRLANGNVGALYLLGEEPDVQKLDGPEVRSLLKKIDAVEIVRQVREHQQTHARAVALEWRVAEMDQPAALEVLLANASAWRSSLDPQQQGQLWPAGTRTGVLATKLGPSAGGPRLLTLETAGRPRLWLAGRPVGLNQTQGHYLATLPAGAEAAGLEIVIDFRDTHAEPTCRVWVADPS